MSIGIEKFHKTFTAGRSCIKSKRIQFSLINYHVKAGSSLDK